MAILMFCLLLQPGLPASFRSATTAAGLLFAGLAAAASCGVAARRSTGRRRRAWQLLTGAAVVAVAGNIVVAALALAPSNTVSDVSIGLALLLSIAGLLNFPTTRRRGLDLLVMALDGVVMGSAVLIIAFVLVYDDLWDSADAPGQGLLTLLIPVLDVVLVAVGLLLVQRIRGAARPALVLLAGGFLMYAVSDLSYAALVAQDEFEFGSLLDLGWIAGYLVIAVSAWYPTPETDIVENDTGAETLDTVIVFAMLIAAAVVQTVFEEQGQSPFIQLAIWIVLVLAAGLRQTLLTVDNARLRRGLEQRVREQTSDLRRLARQNEILLTSVGDGIYGVDADGRITFVNPLGAQVLGYDPEELRGRHAHDTFHAAAADGTAFPWEGCYVFEAIRAGRVTSAEEDVYRRSDGVEFPVEITASPLLDEDVVRGAVVVFRDVTQRQEVDRMKNEFLSVVSHELRTPLTSIRGSLGLLASGSVGALEPRAQSLTAIALESSERLTRLINDILDLERIESGTRPMDLTTLEAADLLAASATELAGLARTSGVRVALGRVEGRVVADRDRVVQTLTNLLGNALKFSERDSIVTLEAHEDGRFVVFAVHDNGRGIPEDKLETVFERFEQVDSSDARQKGGTGLGLAISRGIVERHGGRIWAESTVNSGTTVRFSLPTAHRSAPGHGPSDAPLVLVCDDDAETVDTLSAMLVQHGFRSIGVSDGRTAVSRAVAERPALILLDVRMPGTTGADVVAELREHPRTRAIPVVVVSGLGPDDDPGLRTWAKDWLIKPVTEERLLGAIGAALAGRLADATVLLVEDDDDLASIVTALLAPHGLRVVHARTASEAIRLGAEVVPQVLVLDLQLPDGHGSQVVAEFRRSSLLADVALVVYSAADVEQHQRGDLKLGKTVFLTKGRSGPEALEDRVLDLVNALTGRESEGDS
ncbi:ATP-binding protein [Nocardioides sp. W7]|uniref:hybrid sensor histidine kinase/response regulator n=1 Tax=Nocardioides sp. W7 TaxID=2931390 RepID=UPI001FD1DA14|nr:ATP-binding protein [Nocardioides sp. W7]